MFEADGRLLAVAADGLGGHRHGAAASRAVIDAADRIWHADAGATNVAATLRSIVAEAHVEINALGNDAHSTCVMVALVDARVWWLHVGDSRLYRMRGQYAEQMTRDHSLAQMLLEKGEITEDEVATHPTQSQLMQALGGPEMPDAGEGEAVLSPIDAFLLCTDGFWEVYKPDEMARLLAVDDLEAATRAWVADGSVRGGPTADNLAVAVVVPVSQSQLGRVKGWLRRTFNGQNS